ncbi:unnamed protein product [Urochloa decumbens]|uniref:Disease resistance protein At4g27190-like leucine-rich repeats domain-containing protein n=1 Tax=Urochloa decumbens TaxID=240449 RepID=A0ABC9CBL5_9POAL
MPLQYIYPDNIQEAIQALIPYLEDTSYAAHKAIYFEGWCGLAASAVLRAIADNPPSSLRKKFVKIIHIDCSRWKSRRALQRTIADQLELPPHVMAAFDRQDEEDDFSGVDQGARGQIDNVAMAIAEYLIRYRCLIVFNNGSNGVDDLASCGIPEFLSIKVLWTFRGRLRLNTKIKEEVPSSHLILYREYAPLWNVLLEEEASEITLYAHRLGFLGVTPKVATECCLYLLSLNHKGGSIMDYNWTTHAYNYWVCDGIVDGGEENHAWEVARALHQEILLVDYSSNTQPSFADELNTPEERWILVTASSIKGEKAPPRTTSLFLASEGGSDQTLTPLPNDMFNQADQLRVLKLCHCIFSFSSPPFYCCRNLRFLGLDSCMDQQPRQGEEEDKKGVAAVEILQRLWVLDICCTDWELASPIKTEEEVVPNMREVHIRKGRIWRSNLAWRQLKNLRKLRVIKPTSYWEIGKKDEFIDMVKLELLDLSGNNTMQVLPNLCGATRLKALVLDGCAELDHVGPGLPTSLESFSFDAGAGEDGNNVAKISRITLAGCAKLLDFKLLGSVPNLVELDLSGTAVKILDLKNVVQVQNLRRIFLIGCKQLRSIVWPGNGMQKLRLLCIDTRQEVALFRETSLDSLVCQEQERCCHAHVWITDIRFLQSLGLTSGGEFRWISAPFKLNLYLSCTSKEDGKICNKLEETVCPLLNRTGQVVRSISMACRIYNDISIEERATENDGSSALRFEPQDLHIEMGQGITGINVVTAQGIRALRFTMNRVLSLHVHDCSSITTIIPREIVISTEEDGITWRDLKCCHVERCPKLDTVFHTNYDNSSCFLNLETLQATGLLMARSIWSRARPYNFNDSISFAALRAIHLHLCPRLQYVLPLSFNSTFYSLETLYIVRCGDLRQVFPGEEYILSYIATGHRNGMLEFPRLKHLYLHDLSSLQQICEAKMFAPELKTVRIRGCWGLRRLPATDPHRRDGHLVAVDCEKDWWDSLEWDGLHVGHDPSLFKPRHSAYYKKRLLRTTVLR